MKPHGLAGEEVDGGDDDHGGEPSTGESEMKGRRHGLDVAVLS
jgi:hypothetical protein